MSQKERENLPGKLNFARDASKKNDHPVHALRRADDIRMRRAQATLSRLRLSPILQHVYSEGKKDGEARERRAQVGDCNP